MTAFVSRRGLLGLALAAWLGLLNRRGANRSPAQPAKPISDPAASPPFHWRLANVRDDGAGTTTWTYGRWSGAAPGGQPPGTVTAYRFDPRLGRASGTDGSPLVVTSVYPSRAWPDSTSEPGPAPTDPDPGEEPEAGGPHPGGGGEPGGDR